MTQAAEHTDTSPSSLQSSTSFEAFYDKYAPAFYAEIKRWLYGEEPSAKVLEAAFLKMYNASREHSFVNESLFVWAYKIVQEEISRKKVDVALNSILYSERQSTEPELR